jgi:hypothetical protein
MLATNQRMQLSHFTIAIGNPVNQPQCALSCLTEDVVKSRLSHARCRYSRPDRWAALINITCHRLVVLI